MATVATLIQKYYFKHSPPDGAQSVTSLRTMHPTFIAKPQLSSLLGRITEGATRYWFYQDDTSLVARSIIIMILNEEVDRNEIIAILLSAWSLTLNAMHALWTMLIGS